MELKPWEGPVEATLTVPGDKSLTHRGILMSVLSEEVVELTGWLDAGDTRSSLRLASALGTLVLDDTPDRLVLKGPGLPLREPESPIDCGNSGTTMRIGAGLVTAVPGLSVLTGDASLIRRPMARVAMPLRELGVTILSRQGGLAPLAIAGGPHGGGQVTLNVASAQVKSALLMAGLTADSPITVTEPIATRDHTERLIRAMGGHITVEGGRITVDPGGLRGLSYRIPGDPSSAAFWAALAALRPGRRMTLENVLLNPGRTGFFDVLERMGAQVTRTLIQEMPEPYGRLTVDSEVLRGVTVDQAEVPRMVDEVPLIALLATQCRGVTTIRGAGELRVKESDRITATTNILKAMGASIQEHPDGWMIEGPTPLHGATVQAVGDHRMAMLAAVAATVAEGTIDLLGGEAVAISYPDFFRCYETIRRA